MHHEKNPYEVAYGLAKNPATREQFWSDQAQEIDWYNYPKSILDSSNPTFHRWFKDGQLNLSYNCVDRHAATTPHQKALIWESAMLGMSEHFTYAQLLEHVSKLAGVMRRMGVQKGDRVIIYMPMIPEALFSMLACARLGAIHSLVFGGFSSKELASRIDDSQPSLVVCGSCGLEPNKVVDYKALLNEALLICAKENLTTLVVQRNCGPTNLLKIGRDYDYYTAMRFAEPVDAVPVNSDDPLYILYTSGTTGQPKGIVRDNGGTAVALNWTMKHIMGIHKGDVYFSASDIGWVVGHSFIVYGPLLRGATTILFEGKPTIPDPGIYWRLIEKHQVNGFYTSPTALRSLRSQDPDGTWIKKSNTSSLRSVSMAGERCDVPTFEWIRDGLGILINDNYWQTETGWIISCNFQNLHTFPMKPGSATKPCPGFVVEIMDHDNNPCKPGQMGRVCIKLPLPPSFMLTLYRNDQAFVEKYLTETPGYYTAGDAGYFDDDGYLNVMTRLDDIINTAGHRLSTAAMEEVLLKHKDVGEAAVVAKREELKGEIPVGLVVLKSGHSIQTKTLEKELITLIRKEIGPVASFYHALVVEKLPKTRSGKVLRGTMKKILDSEEFKMPATIEDESVLDKIRCVVKDYGFQQQHLLYRDELDKVEMLDQD